MSTATATDLQTLRAKLADNIESMLLHAKDVGLTQFKLKAEVFPALNETAAMQLLAMLRAAEKHESVQNISVRPGIYSPKSSGGYVLITVTLYGHIED